MVTVRFIRRTKRPVVACPLILLIAVGGCRSSAELAQVRIDNQDLRQQVQSLERTLQQRDATVARLHQQLMNLQTFREDRPADLFAPIKIEIVSLTGGADYDGRPGDDGVTVYLRPLDPDGDPIKAAGEVTIELLDQSVPGASKLIKLYDFRDPEQLRRMWYSRFGTNHYTLRCKFPPTFKPPESRRVTVRATFVDYLTGSVLTAIKEIGISFPQS